MKKDKRTLKTILLSLFQYVPVLLKVIIKGIYSLGNNLSYDDAYEICFVNTFLGIPCAILIGFWAIIITIVLMIMDYKRNHKVLWQVFISSFVSLILTCLIPLTNY